MSQGRSGNSPNRNNIPKAVGRDTSGRWRCDQCTFLNESDTCTMCGAKKPSTKPVRQINRPNKPNPNLRKTEETKKKEAVDVYYDPRDNSVNVPIAGIKKHYYEPDKLPKNIPDKKPQEIKKPKPKPVNSGPNIATLSSINQRDEELKIQKPKRMENGRRDLLGMLQGEANDDVLPCMRKNKK